MRSEEINIQKIIGFWENFNFPPFLISDEIEISLNISEQNYSLITIKEKNRIVNYALNFLRIVSFPNTDAFEVHFIIRSGDNISQQEIGKDLILKCRMYHQSDNKSEVIFQFLNFKELLFVKNN